MTRIISAIIYAVLGQQTKESMSFFWKIYEYVKNGRKGFRERVCGCILHRIYRENCANIPVETTFEGYPDFPHGISGVYISQGAIIGKDCTVFQQVTIGSNTIKGSKGYGAPRIGSNVYIGAGAKIIGNVKIGNNCRIGANCVVTEDIPDNATVVLEHPRVIVRQDQTDNRYVAYGREENGRC